MRLAILGEYITWCWGLPAPLHGNISRQSSPLAYIRLLNTICLFFGKIIYYNILQCNVMLQPEIPLSSLHFFDTCWLFFYCHQKFVLFWAWLCVYFCKTWGSTLKMTIVTVSVCVLCVTVCVLVGNEGKGPIPSQSKDRAYNTITAKKCKITKRKKGNKFEWPRFFYNKSLIFCL